jgi:hypothetical protein
MKKALTGLVLGLYQALTPAAAMADEAKARVEVDVLPIEQTIFPMAKYTHFDKNGNPTEVIMTIDYNGDGVTDFVYRVNFGGQK